MQNTQLVARVSCKHELLVLQSKAPSCSQQHLHCSVFSSLLCSQEGKKTWNRIVRIMFGFYYYL